MVELIDLVALRPIRRKNGTKAVRMADGALLELVMSRVVLHDGKGGIIGEAHHAYLWRIAFVRALVKVGYKVLSAENHVLAVTKLPGDVTPLSERRLISEAINACVPLLSKNPKPIRCPEGKFQVAVCTEEKPIPFSRER